MKRQGGSRTDAGESENPIVDYSIYNKAGEDVTRHFTNVDTVSGTLLDEATPPDEEEPDKTIPPEEEEPIESNSPDEEEPGETTSPGDDKT